MADQQQPNNNGQAADQQNIDITAMFKTINRQLTDPFSAIQSFSYTVRSPTAGHATNTRTFSINAPSAAAESEDQGSLQYWQERLRALSQGERDDLFTLIHRARDRIDEEEVEKEVPGDDEAPVPGANGAIETAPEANRVGAVPGVDEAAIPGANGAIETTPAANRVVAPDGVGNLGTDHEIIPPNPETTLTNAAQEIDRARRDSNPEVLEGEAEEGVADSRDPSQAIGSDLAVSSGALQNQLHRRSDDPSRAARPTAFETSLEENLALAPYEGMTNRRGGRAVHDAENEDADERDDEDIVEGSDQYYHKAHDRDNHEDTSDDKKTSEVTGRRDASSSSEAPRNRPDITAGDSSEAARQANYQSGLERLRLLAESEVTDEYHRQSVPSALSPTHNTAPPPHTQARKAAGRRPPGNSDRIAPRSQQVNTPDTPQSVLNRGRGGGKSRARDTGTERGSSSADAPGYGSGKGPGNGKGRAQPIIEESNDSQNGDVSDQDTKSGNKAFANTASGSTASGNKASASANTPSAQPATVQAATAPIANAPAPPTTAPPATAQPTPRRNPSRSTNDPAQQFSEQPNVSERANETPYLDRHGRPVLGYANPGKEREYVNALPPSPEQKKPRRKKQPSKAEPGNDPQDPTNAVNNLDNSNTATPARRPSANSGKKGSKSSLGGRAASTASTAVAKSSRKCKSDEDNDNDEDKDTTPPRERANKLGRIYEEIALVGPADDVADKPDASEDGLEASGPSDAHRFGKRPAHVTKPNNGRQATIGHGSRHGDSANSWAGPPAVDDDQPAQRPIPRKRPAGMQADAPAVEAEEGDDVDESPKKKQKRQPPRGNNTKSKQKEVSDRKKKQSKVLGWGFPKFHLS